MTTENDLTDEELESLEEQRKVVEDRYDRLELLRRALNSTHLEKMFVIKRSTAMGPTCPYYLKARRLFLEKEEAETLSLLESILKEFSLKEDRTESSTESVLKEFKHE
jgi:hypothetical protein